MEIKKILICEDQKTVSRMMARYFIEEIGLHVEESNSFDDVKRMLATTKYDLVICDTLYQENEPVGQMVMAYRKMQFLDYSQGKPLNHDTLFIINECYEDIHTTLTFMDKQHVIYSPIAISSLLSPVEIRRKSDKEQDFLEKSRKAESKIKAVELALANRNQITVQ